MLPRICATFVLFLASAAAQEAFLPTPPTAPSVILLPHPTGTISAALSASWFDTSSRANIRDLYNNVWLPSRSTSIGWTGSIAGCIEGTTSASWQAATVTGLNFVRNLAGISGSISLDPVTSAKDQKAALMFSANNQISHTPPTNWTCYSTDGATAAGNSNICLSSVSLNPGCLELYMADFGSNNSAVGHRRWILYPQTQTFGSGDIPATGPNWSSNALWVFDGNFGGPRPSTRESYVAWPPPGYFPYQFLPVRWSFAYAGADFSQATINVTKNGSALPVLLEQVQNGYGENSIVWYDASLNPSSTPNFQPPATDVPYSVTIGNVIIGGTLQSFTYQVTVFDPASSGSSQPAVNSLSPQSGAAANQVFTLTFSDPAGYSNLDVLNVLINPYLDGRFSCYLAYSRPSNTLYLVNDTGTALLPGMTLNGSGSVSNSYCTLIGAGTSAAGLGNTLTLTVNILFNQTTYAKDHVVYAAARNLTGGNSGWTTMGVWRVPSLSPGVTVSGLSPSAGSGSTQAFTVTYHDPAGAANITNSQLLIHADLNANAACYLGYVQSFNLLYLVNDTNTGLLPPVMPNSGGGSAQNNQCILNGAGTTVTSAGGDLILTISLTFKQGFTGTKVAYAAFQNAASVNTGWEPRGLWIVP